MPALPPTYRDHEQRLKNLMRIAEAGLQQCKWYELVKQVSWKRVIRQLKRELRQLQDFKKQLINSRIR